MHVRSMRRKQSEAKLLDASAAEGTDGSSPVRAAAAPTGLGEFSKQLRKQRRRADLAEAEVEKVGSCHTPPDSCNAAKGIEQVGTKEHVHENRE